MIDEKEKTALATSVGADERQSIQTYNTDIIATGNTEINHPDENFDEIYRQFQRMNDPAYLHTVSMNDLYETVFMRDRPSLTVCSTPAPTCLQERPRWVSHSSWRSLPTTSAPDRSFGIMMSAKARFYTLPWRTITKDCRSGCSVCSA